MHAIARKTSPECTRYRSEWKYQTLGVLWECPRPTLLQQLLAKLTNQQNTFAVTHSWQGWEKGREWIKMAVAEKFQSFGNEFLFFCFFGLNMIKTCWLQHLHFQIWYQPMLQEDCEKRAEPSVRSWDQKMWKDIVEKTYVQCSMQGKRMTWICTQSSVCLLFTFCILYTQSYSYQSVSSCFSPISHHQ